MGWLRAVLMGARKTRKRRLDTIGGMSWLDINGGHERGHGRRDQEPAKGLLFRLAEPEGGAGARGPTCALVRTGADRRDHRGGLATC
jgi:hypothetical protein